VLFNTILTLLIGSVVLLVYNRTALLSLAGKVVSLCVGKVKIVPVGGIRDPLFDSEFIANS